MLEMQAHTPGKSRRYSKYTPDRSRRDSNQTQGRSRRDSKHTHKIEREEKHNMQGDKAPDLEESLSLDRDTFRHLVWCGGRRDAR